MLPSLSERARPIVPVVIDGRKMRQLRRQLGLSQSITRKMIT